MYGLLCESLHDFIKESYGDDVWKLVRERADVRLHSFVTHQVRWSCGELQCCLTVIALLLKPFCSPRHQNVFNPPTACEQVYSESVIPRIAKAASGVTGTPYNELMNSWGVYFLGFVGKYGYDRILKVKERKAMTETVDAHFLYLCVGKCIIFFKFIVLAHFICLWTFC